MRRKKIWIGSTHLDEVRPNLSVVDYLSFRPWFCIVNTVEKRQSANYLYMRTKMDEMMVDWGYDFRIQ